MLPPPLTLSWPKGGGATRSPPGDGDGCAFVSGGDPCRMKPPNRKSKSPSPRAESGTVIVVVTESAQRKAAARHPQQSMDRLTSK